jgi:hypothetical protein
MKLNKKIEISSELIEYVFNFTYIVRKCSGLNLNTLNNILFRFLIKNIESTCKKLEILFQHAHYVCEKVNFSKNSLLLQKCNFKHFELLLRKVRKEEFPKKKYRAMQ